MNVVSRTSLAEITGIDHDLERVSDPAVARIQYEYDGELIRSIGFHARNLCDEHSNAAPSGENRFLGLRHLRQAHVPIVDFVSIV